MTEDDMEFNGHCRHCFVPTAQCDCVVRRLVREVVQLKKALREAVVETHLGNMSTQELRWHVEEALGEEFDEGEWRR